MPDINSFEKIYRRTLKGAGSTGSLVRLTTKPLSSKKLRLITHATVENQTNDFTKLRIGISNRGVDYYFDELITVVADELVVERSTMMLGDGDQFFAEFTGTTTGDVLIANLFGRETKLP